MSAVILHVWPPAWGVASCDPACLRALAFARLVYGTADASISVSYVTSWSDLAQPLPFMTVDGSQIIEAHQIDAYLLKNLNKEKLSQADAKSKAEATALRCLIDERIGNLVLHSLFSLPYNWSRTTRSAYCDTLKFPANIAASSLVYRKAIRRLENVGLWGMAANSKDDEELLKSRAAASPGDAFLQQQLDDVNQRKALIKDEFDKQTIVQQAREVFSIVLQQLDKKRYLFGSDMSSVDAVLGAYLAIILNAPLQQDFLRNLLETDFPDLVKYAAHARHVILDPLKQLPVVQPFKNNVLVDIKNTFSLTKIFAFHKPMIGKRNRTLEQRKVEQKRLLFILFTASTLLGFTLWQGIITFPDLASFRGEGNIRDSEGREESDD